MLQVLEFISRKWMSKFSTPLGIPCVIKLFTKHLPHFHIQRIFIYDTVPKSSPVSIFLRISHWPSNLPNLQWYYQWCLIITVIFQNIRTFEPFLRTFEPLSIAKNPNKPTNQPNKQTLGVFEKLLVKKHLGNMTTVNERQAEAWMLTRVTCIESCVETKIYDRW